MKKLSIIILISIALSSLFLSMVNFRVPSPPCLNADEASFAYNAYSLLKTGKDEYGTILPLRLKSFGDFKMPLLSYVTVPFIAIFGLNEWGARSVNVFLSLLLPIAVYMLTQELFGKKKVSLLAAFFSATSLGLHIVARHLHEAYLAAFLTTVSLLFLIRFLKNQNVGNGVGLGLFTLLMLFSYHPGRLFVVLFIVVVILYLFQSKTKNKVLLTGLILLSILGIFSITDLIYKPKRLKNLIFFANQGITLKVQELKTEGGMRYLYSPLVVGIRDIVFEHLSYFSPQFLLQNGDQNDRFGYKGMGLITPIEFILFFIGLYYVFKKKQPWRFVLIFLIFFSPLSASLSWATSSLTRTMFSLVLLSIIAAYGGLYCFESFQSNFRNLVISGVIIAFLFFWGMQWDFYLFHYPKRLTTIHAWQCGYKEVVSNVKKNYSQFDRLYVTKDIGMPYIFFLFYLSYPPEQYQKQALLTPPDEYGFGQVERFDKFVFEYKDPVTSSQKTMYVGSIDNVKTVKNHYVTKTIAPFGEPMFVIIEKDNLEKNR